MTFTYDTLSNHAEHPWCCTWPRLHVTKFGTSDFPFTILISLYPIGQPTRLKECVKKSTPRWPQSEAVDDPAGNVPPSLTLLLLPLLPLTSLHLPSQVTNSPTSLLDSQRGNSLLTSFSLLIVSPSIPRMTYKEFLRLFCGLELRFPLLLLFSLPLLFLLPLFFSLLLLFLLLLPLPFSLQLPSLPKHTGRSWRPIPQTYTMESLIWTATISVSNIRTIFLPLELRDLPGFLLPHLFCKTGSASASSNKSRNMMLKLLSRLCRTSSKHSSDKVWMTHKPLWTSTRRNSRRTPSISRRKSSTGQPTWSTCKRSSKSLIPVQL